MPTIATPKNSRSASVPHRSTTRKRTGRVGDQGHPGTKWCRVPFPVPPLVDAPRLRFGTSVLQLMIVPELPWKALVERAAEIRRGQEAAVPFGHELPRLFDLLRLRVDAHDFILKTRSENAKATIESRTAAADKVSTIIDYSRLLLRISRADAAQLFEAAVELTKEIDREAYDQIEVISRLASAGTTLASDARRDLALEVFRIVTGSAERLAQYYDGFPWVSATRALAVLSAPVALAAAGRWADEGRADLETSLPPLLIQAVSAGDIASPVAAALTILLRSPHSEVVDAVLAAARTETERALLAGQFARDILLHGRWTGDANAQVDYWQPRSQPKPGVRISTD